MLVAGADAKPVAEAAAKLDGVAKVLHADAPQLEHQLAEEMAALIASLMGNYDAVVAPATTSGKNIAPRVAAALDVMQISDIIKVVSPDTFERPIYAGNAIQTVQSPDAKKVITVRITAFPSGRRGWIGGDRDHRRAGSRRPFEFEKAELTKSDRPELASARIIISGGRGLQSGENFKKYSSRSPTRSAPRSAPPAPPSMPATCPTTCRSARPARWWRPSSTSRSASPARSSISPA